MEDADGVAGAEACTAEILLQAMRMAQQGPHAQIAERSMTTGMAHTAGSPPMQNSSVQSRAMAEAGAVGAQVMAGLAQQCPSVASLAMVAIYLRCAHPSWLHA